MLALAGIVILGILAHWVAWRLKLPAILPLILIGLAVGPISTFFTPDGSKWLEPTWNGEDGLFPGERMFNFVSLAISIILFEGGLTLKKAEVLNVGPVILKLITIGSAITFFGAGVASHFIMGLSWPISFLFASLIIVTGPTVISPILRNIPLKKDVSAVLKWEGILIDPIGALVAVLVYEFISVDAGGEFTQKALEEFAKIVVIGGAFGFSGAYLLYLFIKRNWIPHYLMNVVSLSFVLGVFVLSDVFAKESGLLSVVVMGMVLGNINLPNLKDILYFKESLSLLLISILFILLAANINVNDLYLIYKWETAALFAVVVFAIRPVGVFLSTWGSNLKTNEKMFISWVGPRGIVAAGIASLFGLKLIMKGEPYAEYITPLVFMIVLGTVLLNATTARLFARVSGVFLKNSNGIVIIGASHVCRVIAKYLLKNGRHVVLVDSNPDNIERANETGIVAYETNIFSDDLTLNIEFNDIGYLLALTASDEVNKYALDKFEKYLGEKGSFRLISAQEIGRDDVVLEKIFSQYDDYLNLSEVARDYPQMNEVNLHSKEHYIKEVVRLNEERKTIPIFIKDLEGVLHIIASLDANFEIEEGFKLVYLGKPMELLNPAPGRVSK